MCIGEELKSEDDLMNGCVIGFDEIDCAVGYAFFVASPILSNFHKRSILFPISMHQLNFDYYLHWPRDQELAHNI